MSNDNIPDDAEKIERWLSMLVESNSTVELRVLFDEFPPRILHYRSSELKQLVQDGLKLGRDAKGIYWVMNPLPANWDGSPAKDMDIQRRRWLLIDCDPKRKGSVSSSDSEKGAAQLKMVEIQTALTQLGWPKPVIADSSNGFHLLYRIDLPGDDKRLVFEVLHVLARQFDDDQVQVDTKVGNASRICKLYGTISRKGENTPERPHRVSQILSIPAELEVVRVELMHRLIEECPNSFANTQTKLASSTPHSTTGSSRTEHIRRASRYLAAMPASISGERGHDRLLKAASVLVNDFGLSDEDAYHLLTTEFNPHCDPPWGDHDIRRKISEAKKNPPNRQAKGTRAIPADETSAIVDEPWPNPIDPVAFYGVAGDIVRKIEPHTEADPVAILVQTLTAAGNVIGRHSHFRVEATRHYANLFAVIVGSSSAGRKGTSGDQVNRVIQRVDEDWFALRVFGGLVSGEGLIWQVRDPIVRQEAIRERGRKDGKVIEYQEVIVDEGVSDKRLLVYETEFSAVLKAKSRERNSLSEVLRQAWDSGRLSTAAKNSPAKSTNAHTSLIGHITQSELREVSSQVDMVNGLANRFLWCCVRRSKLLPDGGEVHKVDFDREVAMLKGAVEFASEERELVRDREAATEWRRIYPALTEERPGAVGAVCNRGAAQVVRLSLLYALLDSSPAITIAHLRAAMALWTYCEASVKHIFGSNLSNRTADAILHALRCASESGLSRTAISDLFNRNKSKSEIDTALQVLFSAKLARIDSLPTNGRSVETWFATA